MQIIFPDSHEASPGLWITKVAPQQLTMLGIPSVPKCRSSVLMVIKPRFDEEKAELIVEASQVILLNLGMTARTVVIDADGGEALGDGADGLAAQGPGDKDFRYLVDVLLKGEAREAAQDLLTKVRRASPGDLKRGERNNFSNTPDNFWYVIVQPRTQALSVTVRGDVEKFQPSALNLVMDRPGFTRFQVRSLDEVEEALRLIESSTRRLSRYS